MADTYVSHDQQGAAVMIQEAAELGGQVDQEIQNSYIPQFIQEPLAGEGLYLTAAEFRKKADSINTFWAALAEALYQDVLQL